MKTLFLTLFILCTFGNVSNAQDICKKSIIKVAVIDTGLGMRALGQNNHLCNEGHKDFSGEDTYSADFGTKDPVPTDSVGHGTNIVGVINQYSGEAKYCIVVLKFYNDVPFGGAAAAEINAIKYATNIGVDIINFSGGGFAYSEEEHMAIEAFLKKGGQFLTSAGNHNDDLEKAPMYPAKSDPNVIVVGSLDNNNRVSKFSNYGKRVDLWEKGEKVVGNGLQATGTSQATAIATGKFLAFINKKCYKNKRN